MSYCCRFAHTLFLNLPIVSYYEAGTQITPTHGHAALMGVFGMLAIALMVFCLRQASSDARWPGIEKYVKVAFWGTNIGLAPMILMRLFPSGVMQLWDVVEPATKSTTCGRCDAACDC